MRAKNLKPYLFEMLDAETIAIINNRSVPIEKIPSPWQIDVDGQKKWIVQYPKQIVSEFKLNSATAMFDSLDEAEKDLEEKIKKYAANWKTRAKGGGKETVRSGKPLLGVKDVKIKWSITEWTKDRLTVDIIYERSDGSTFKPKVPKSGTPTQVLTALKNVAQRYDPALLSRLEAAEKEIVKLQTEGVGSISQRLKRFAKNMFKLRGAAGKTLSTFLTQVTLISIRYMYNWYQLTYVWYVDNQFESKSDEIYYNNVIKAWWEGYWREISVAAIGSGVVGAFYIKNNTPRRVLIDAIKKSDWKDYFNPKKGIIGKLVTHGLIYASAYVLGKLLIEQVLDEAQQAVIDETSRAQEKLNLPVVRPEYWKRPDTISKEELSQVLTSTDDKKVLDEMSAEEFNAFMESLLQAN